MTTGTYPFLPEIWRIQRQIFLHPYGVRLEQLARHPAIASLAGRLASFYFHESRRRTTTAYEQIRHCYILAILLYPLQHRLLQRVYKPSWSLPVLCGWIRKAVNRRTGQFFFRLIEIPASCRDESPLVDLLNSTDKDWLRFQLDMLACNSKKTTTAGRLCRHILEPFLYSGYDARLDNEYGLCRNPYQRKVRRKSGKATASGLRVGKRVYLFGDRLCGRENGWLDLRRDTAQVEQFFCRYQQTTHGEGVNIMIDPAWLQQLKQEIRVILDSGANPHFKFLLGNKKMVHFGEAVQGASGAGEQLFELDRWYTGKVRRIILPALSPVERERVSRKIYDVKKALPGRLIHPVNLFHRETVEARPYLAMYSPYR